MTLPASTYSTHRDLIHAAASYFGIPVEQLLMGSEITAGATFNVTLQIALTMEDVQGIVTRAKALKQGVPEQPTWDNYLQQQEPAPAITLEEVARNEQAFKDDDKAADQRAIILQLRGEYDKATHAERNGRSRWQYVVDRAREMDEQAPVSQGIEGRHVTHVDAPEETPENMPNVMWLTSNQASVDQMRFSTDQKEIDGLVHYAINVQMLTPEQRAELGLA